MNENLELGLRVTLIGIGATGVMDAWAWLLRRLGIPSLNFAYLGRLIGHLLQGQWPHGSIAKAPKVAGELWLGWTAHYSIGIALCALLVAIYGLSWARSPTLGPALLIGVVTVAAPLLILQPALGAGIASTKTAAPLANSLKSLATHTVFGLGLYLAARLVAVLLPAAR